MKKEIYLHVPQPCHEDWEQMTQVQQGRFCNSCAKQVVDFSKMSDKQILEVLSKAAGKTCGRFSSDQLERPVINEIPSTLKPYKFFLSAFIPAFLFANGNDLKAQVKGKVATYTAPSSHQIMGKLLPSIKSVKITGQIKDERGEPMAGASIMIKGTAKGVAADETGTFSIDYPEGYNHVTLRITLVGFAAKEIKVRKDNIKPLKIIFTNKDALSQGEVVIVGGLVSYEEDNDELYEVPKIEYKGRVINEMGEAISYATIKLNAMKSIVADSNGIFHVYARQNKKKLKLTVSSTGYEALAAAISLPANKNDTVAITLKNKAVLEEVVVKCTASESLTGIAGGLSVVRTVSMVDTAHTFIQKIFNNEMFKVYPNPAFREANITLTFRKAGEYVIQLFDNSGKLYVQKELINNVSNQQFSFQLPSAMNAGIYYLKAVNTSAKKQFIDKLIIQ